MRRERRTHFREQTPTGSRSNNSFSSKYDGKDSAVTGSGMPGGADTVAMTRVNSNMVRTILKKGGTAIGVSNTEVSRDGKVTTVKGSGVDAEGKKFSMVSVYDEQ